MIHNFSKKYNETLSTYSAKMAFCWRNVKIGQEMANSLLLFLQNIHIHVRCTCLLKTYMSVEDE